MTVGDGGAGFIRAGAGNNFGASSSALPLNQWSYVTATFSGTEFRIYINGVLSSVTAASATISDTGLVKTIGAVNTACTSQQVSGLLDSVHIFSKILTASEVGSMYAEGLGTHRLAKVK